MINNKYVNLRGHLEGSSSLGRDLEGPLPQTLSDRFLEKRKIRKEKKTKESTQLNLAKTFELSFFEPQFKVPLKSLLGFAFFSWERPTLRWFLMNFTDQRNSFIFVVQKMDL